MQDLKPRFKVSKQMQKRIIYLVYLFVVAVFIYFHPNQFSQNKQILENSNTNYSREISQSENNIYFIGRVMVTKIVDGDTIHVVAENGTEDIIRFLAVNTPEIHNASSTDICHGKISTEFTKQNLFNKYIFLWGDSTQPKRDKYNRTLAYISLEPNANTNTPFFNELLITTGNAKVYRADPPAANYYKYLELQKRAQSQKLGMWNSEVCR